ncbi:site-specific integrase [Sporosarcina sp. P33]|uniref:tyrosine-type recombinase/integrase n=1 Tax=Sporosarcina sp. P33 TaxID=1930764 RepID=UPI0009BD567D|nr:site-specific integrase [Sporosarcina sp. P33]ARD48836.1 integrase [Sporosarcina sp. P33]
MTERLIDFQSWLEDDGKAAKTVETYLGNIKHYYGFLNENGSGVEQLLSRALVVRYIKYLEKEKYAISSINAKVTSLLAFNKFLLEQKEVDRIFVSLRKDQVKVAAGSEQIVEAFLPEEVEELLTYVENEQKVSLRNKAIVYLLLYGGMRISELCSIQMADMDFLTRTLFIKGKGGKYREIMLRQDVVEVVQEYIKTERSQSKFQLSPYLFVSNRSEKIVRDAVNSWMKKVSKEIGFKVYPHKFRRTFVTFLLKKQVPITTVAKLTGHYSISVLEKHYNFVSRSTKQQAVDLL